MGNNQQMRPGTIVEQGPNQFCNTHVTYTDRKTVDPWLVPRATNSLYTGRKELSELLAQKFSFDLATPPKQQRTFVIVGLGGTGKSEVCLKFAEDHRDEYAKTKSFANIPLTI